MLCECGSGKPVTKRSHAYGWEACEDCVDDKLLEDLEDIDDGEET